MRAALEKAEERIESETLVLTRRESQQLLALLANPPPPNDALRQLMSDYAKGATHGEHTAIAWSPR